MQLGQIGFAHTTVYFGIESLVKRQCMSEEIAGYLFPCRVFDLHNPTLARTAYFSRFAAGFDLNHRLYKAICDMLGVNGLSFKKCRLPSS